MNKPPFGINYDYWHGILAWLVFSAVSSLIYHIMDGGQFAAVIAMYCAATSVLSVQGINEALQLFSSEEVSNHGGYEKFAINSKRDWKFALLGLFAGLFTFIFIIIIL